MDHNTHISLTYHSLFSEVYSNRGYKSRVKHVVCISAEEAGFPNAWVTYKYKYGTCVPPQSVNLEPSYVRFLPQGPWKVHHLFT